MKFLFECLAWYLTSECGEQVRYKVEHRKRNPISTCSHVLFRLLYKATDVLFLTIFRRFPNSFENFRRFPEVVRQPDQRFWTFSENFRRFPRKNRWGFDHTATHLLRNYVTIAMIIFTLVKITCYFYVWNNILFSFLMRCLREKAQLVLHWCLYNNNIL